MLKSYIQIALKVLARRKFFTFVSLFGISFTLLILMVVTALLDHVFSPHAPEVHSNRTLSVFRVLVESEHSAGSGFPGYKVLDECARDLPNVEETSFFRFYGHSTTYVNDEKIRSFVKGTDAAYWKILDFDLKGGRWIDEQDFNEHRRVAVLNETTRSKFFGDDEDVIGRSVEVDGRDFEVIGVVADVPLIRIVSYAEIWIPYSTSRTDEYKERYRGDFVALLLAKSRSDFPRIRKEYAARVVAMEPPPGFDTVESAADTFFETVSRGIFGSGAGPSHSQKLRAALVGMGLLFMLLPTLNLVNLNLSRILERASEIGVRRAFGASSAHLVFQFIVENVVLTLIGCVLGFIFSAVVFSVINSSGLIPYAQISLNIRVLGWGVLVALFFGVFSGVYPAWRMSRLDPAISLKGSAS